MAFDVQRWLTEDMGFSAEESAAMAPKFGDPKRVSALETGYANTAATRAAMDQINNARTELDAANQKLNTEIAEWATLTAAEKSRAGELQNSLHATQAKVLALTQKLTTVAGQYGVDVKTLGIDDMPTPPVAPPAAPPVDLSRYVPVEQFSAVASYNVELPFKLQQIVTEHQQLTGEVLDTRPILAELRQRVGKPNAVVDPYAIWEEKYDIAAKRTAKAEADLNAKLHAEYERGQQDALSTSTVPVSNPSGRSSPILRPRGDSGAPGQRTSVLKRPQPQGAVNAAAAALRTGKFRQAG